MKRLVYILVFGVFALAVGVLLNGFVEDTPSTSPDREATASQESKSLQKAVSIAAPEHELPEFTLKDHDGNPFTRDSLKGRWHFMFFGYTHCPDICPVTLQTINETLQKLPEDVATNKIDALFISVDPERDDLGKLKNYVHYFNEAITGVTGDDAALAALADSLGIIYRRVDNKENPKNYLIDHSAAILLINPDAQLAAVLSPPHDPELMAQDFKTLATPAN